VLVTGDLCQLPPVQGTAVFHSPVWQLFYPLFLCNSQRQLNDNQYFNLLEEVRLGRISDASWQMLQRKHSQYSNTLTSANAFNTTSIVGYKQSAERLNISLCNLLQVTCEDDILISTAIDKVNGEVWSSEHSQRMFKQHTNLPVKVRLQAGARVMYLTNDMINQGICNGTIGIVTKVIQQIEQIHVTFIGSQSLIHAIISPKTSYFSVNATNASRRQFPLQNCFALTVHKSQGLTLPHISIYLDKQFFAAGQAYTALSRAPSWDVVEIPCLDKQAFSVDQGVIREYERLKSKAATNPLITCSRSQ
jgi:ATP-dependent DNA helicase PIF1